jgi:hypothetical protein
MVMVLVVHWQIPSLVRTTLILLEVAILGPEILTAKMNSMVSWIVETRTGWPEKWGKAGVIGDSANLQ